jgi:hypothetical protein
MKTLIFVLVCLFAVSGFANRPYGISGCGLGSKTFEKKDSQVLASLLNITGMQSFAISSGTSNCMDDGMMKRRKEASLFIEVNKEALAKDASRGQGETVKSLSHLFQCQDEAQLGEALQKNYGTLFTKTVGSDELTLQIVDVIHGDKALNCHI